MQVILKRTWQKYFLDSKLFRYLQELLGSFEVNNNIEILETYSKRLKWVRVE